MVTEINNILENASTLTNIFGNGSGFSHIFTSTDQASNASQLHNDILRIRIDYGYIGIFGLIIIILNALTKNKFYMSIFFYSLTLLLTDNILTYTYYWITFFILVSAQRKFELLNTTRDKKLKVLIIHNKYKEHGGEDAVVKNETAILENGGHEVKNFIVSNRNIKDIFDKLAAFKKSKFDHKTYNMLKNELIEFNPDIVHIHNFWPLLGFSGARSCLRYEYTRYSNFA